jgi:hypothetical protein
MRTRRRRQMPSLLICAPTVKNLWLLQGAGVVGEIARLPAAAIEARAKQSRGLLVALPSV